MHRRLSLPAGFGVLLTLLVLASPARAELVLEGHLWRPPLDGEARIVERGIGTLIDFERDLGMGDEDVPAVRLSWFGQRGFLTLSYERVQYEGDRVVERTIEFSGQRYTFGTRVASELEVTRAVLQAAWQPLATADRRVAFGPMVEIAGLWFDGRLEAPELAPPVREEDSLEAPAPAIGAALDVRPLDRLHLFLRGAAVQVGGTGSYRSLEAGVIGGPFGPLAVTGGWRAYRFRYTDRPDAAELDLGGPYLGLALSF